MTMMRSVLLRSNTTRSLRSAAANVLAAHPRLFSTPAAALKDEYEFVKVEKPHENVGVITLHRPKALNALCDGLFADLIHAATALDNDDAVGCLVLTGSPKAFAAGADISEMKDRKFDYAYKKVRGSQPRERSSVVVVQYVTMV